MQLNNNTRKLIAETLRRSGAVESDKNTATPDSQPIFLRDLFPAQRQILDDPAKRKALLCGRRFGKTTLLVSALLRDCYLYPGSLNAYIAINRAKAKDLMWRPLKAFNAKYNLNMQFSEQDMQATTPNGSRIWCMGCNDESTVENLRGGGYRSLAIDEAGSFKAFLEYLVVDAIGPALTDYDGTLYLSGTPNRSCTGYFYDITAGNKQGQYRVWHYTMLDNPYLPRWKGKRNYRKIAQQVLEDIRKENGWDESNSKYQREYMANWTRDNTLSVVNFETDLNTYTTLPNEELHYVVGCDFGVEDQFCIVLGAYTEYDPTFYIVETYKDNHLSYAATCAAILEYDQKYSPEIIAADPSPGAQFIQDLSEQYNIPIVAAKKREKAEYLDLLNDDFKSGHIKINASLQAEIEELKTLQWADKATNKLTGSDHFFDAMRYCWRETVGRSIKTKPTFYTTQHEDRLKDHESALKQKISKEQRNDEWWNETEIP